MDPFQWKVLEASEMSFKAISPLEMRKIRDELTVKQGHVGRSKHGYDEGQLSFGSATQVLAPFVRVLDDAKQLHVSLTLFLDHGFGYLLDCRVED